MGLVSTLLWLGPVPGHCGPALSPHIFLLELLLTISLYLACGCCMVYVPAAGESCVCARGFGAGHWGQAGDAGASADGTVAARMACAPKARYGGERHERGTRHQQLEWDCRSWPMCPVPAAVGTCVCVFPWIRCACDAQACEGGPGHGQGCPAERGAMLVLEGCTNLCVLVNWRALCVPV